MSSYKSSTRVHLVRSVDSDLITFCSMGIREHLTFVTDCALHYFYVEVTQDDEDYDDDDDVDVDDVDDDRYLVHCKSCTLFPTTWVSRRHRIRITEHRWTTTLHL